METGQIELKNWGLYPVHRGIEMPLHSPFHPEKELLFPGIARGMGRCYGDSALADRVFATAGLNKVISFDRNEGIFTAEAGISFEEILRLIVPAGWFLPVTPGTKFISLGGAIASDIHGKNHHLEGSFSRHLLWMEIFTASGQIERCSREERNELFWMSCGGMGLSGIILRASFRLKKIETAYIRQNSIKTRNLEEVLKLLHEKSTSTYSVAWIDCLAKGKDLGRSILLLGEHAVASELPQKFAIAPLKFHSSGKWSVPFHFPPQILGNWSVKIFNSLFYNKQMSKVKESFLHYDPYFYPLDKIHHWNRIYGKRGFVQYQFVIPFRAESTLVKIIAMISGEGKGSFLSVLKTFGPQDDGNMAFPTEGYTLALDFPVEDSLFPFLDRLDELVLNAGGRLYLSKDARMKAEMLELTYPQLKHFKSFLKQQGDNFFFRSIQSDRLGITSK